MKTPLGKVKGLGSAGSGVHHWWMQRLTALALIPLFAWILVSLVSLLGASHPATVAWIAHPVTSTLLVIFVIALFYHLKLGGQVIIEDYIHHRGWKLAAELALLAACWGLGIVSIIAILKITFGN